MTPRDFTCPSCNAQPGSPCKRPSGHPVFGGGFHAGREKLLAEAIGVAANSSAHSKPTAEQAGIADLPLFGTKELF